MQNLFLEATKHSPLVSFDSKTGLLELRGGSIPEDTYKFYEPLIDWIETYVESPQPKTELAIHLTYFNTSSSKQILELFRKLEPIHKSGLEILIKWFYDAEEDDMLEAGEDYESIVKVPFQMVEIIE